MAEETKPGLNVDKISEEHARHRNVESIAHVLLNRTAGGNESALDPQIPRTELAARVKGCVLASCCGDVLGANTEFMSMQQVAEHWGVVRDFKHTSRRPLGMGTDDSEALLACCQAVCNCAIDAPLDERDAVKELCDAFNTPPRKGYGPATTHILTQLSKGAVDPSVSGTMCFPQGSFGNGALMRIAPVGLRFALAGERFGHDKVPFSLDDDVRAATRCTHSSTESLTACALFCRLIGDLLRNDGDKALPVLRSQLLNATALAAIEHDAVRERLSQLTDLVERIEDLVEVLA